ncbi:MAG: hypothetical protein LUB59_02010 [Candidatus Gastranaerophilales bacterium]|nr:hypothetical protein [Candidatus Gastranaerophilales bacterium]
MLPKKLKFLQVYNFDSTMAKFHTNVSDNFYINTSGLTTGSYSTTSTGEQIGAILGSAAINFAGAVVAAKITNSGSNATAAYSQVSNAAATAVQSHASNLTTLINNFSTKYGQFGLTLNNDGSVSGGTYASVKNGIEQQIKTLNDSVANEGDAANNNTAYLNAKSAYDAAVQNKQSHDNFISQANSIAAANSGKITVAGSNDDRTATATEITPGDFKKFLSGDDQNANDWQDKVKSLGVYQNEAAARKLAAEQFNQAIKGAKDLSSKLTSGQTFDEAITSAKAAMDNAGKEKVGNDSNSDLTAAGYQEQLNALNAKLASLGSEAEFNSAVNAIKQENANYQAALQVQNQEQASTEWSNAAATDKKALKKAKKGGHTGIRGWFYDITHRDSKDKNVQTAKATYNNSAAQANTEQQALYNLYNQILSSGS